jgi:uroporphyrinogen-III synthase
MSTDKIPILLLKTKSTPNDSYDEYFSSTTTAFNPIFIPVLEHRPNTSNLRQVWHWLRHDELRKRYGGMIFTSQRAVEAFAQVVQELEEERMMEKGSFESSMTCPDECPVASLVVLSFSLFINSLLHFPLPLISECSFVRASATAQLTFPSSISAPPQVLSDSSSTPVPIFPFYTVGPATSRTLTTLLTASPTILSPLCPEILGSETGNGESLAKYILEHYRSLHTTKSPSFTSTSLPEPSTDTGRTNDMKSTQLPPLLFLVGEQRRDIIPNTLTAPSLPPDRIIQVDEVVVYETGVMKSFPTDLDRVVQNIQCQSQTPSPSQPPPPTVTETGAKVTGKIQANTSIDTEPTNQLPGNTHHQHATPFPTSTPAISPTATTKITATTIIIIIFSPSGCPQLLHQLFFHQRNRIQALSTDHASNPPRSPIPPPPTKYLTITIGPTTYTYLQSELGFTADACAETPSPAGVGKAVEEVLRRERGNDGRIGGGRDRDPNAGLTS